VVRMKSKEQAIKAVANWVDPESIIDVGATRTFDTKKQATAQAKARHTIYLDATKLSEGASPSTAEPVEEKAANPVRKLKNKLLR
jgi:hypothetical protein